LEERIKLSFLHFVASLMLINLYKLQGEKKPDTNSKCCKINKQPPAMAHDREPINFLDSESNNNLAVATTCLTSRMPRPPVSQLSSTQMGDTASCASKRKAGDIQSKRYLSVGILVLDCFA
jgi:hypothetical protein